MWAVMGGWMCGYGMSILSTFALTYLCVQPQVLKVVQKYLDIPGLMFAVPISILTGFGWTMIGMLLGSLYLLGDFDQRAGALGARSWEFLFIIAAMAWIPVPIMFLFSRRLWWMWIGMAFSFIGMFGWLMPVLAEQ
jgi:hypothetical protein